MEVDANREQQIYDLWTLSELVADESCSIELLHQDGLLPVLSFLPEGNSTGMLTFPATERCGQAPAYWMKSHLVPAYWMKSHLLIMQGARQQLQESLGDWLLQQRRSRCTVSLPSKVLPAFQCTTKALLLHIAFYPSSLNHG